jgi:hypothetical protein
MTIKPDMIISTVDGPFYAPNHKRTIRVQRPSPTIPQGWECTDFVTGELLVIQESKLLQSLSEQQPPNE